MHNGRLIDKANGYGIIDCETCGFIHTDPVPAPEELESVYRDEYYKDEKPLYIERTIEDLRWWETVYDDRYEFLENESGKGSILDVGSGPGYFLKRGLERGWKVMGIEPSKQAAAHARTLGVEVENAFLDEKLASSINRRFDAVHLSEVLEHVPDPAGILRLAHSLLEDGGIVCCVAPNDFSPVQKTLSERLNFSHYWLAPPHHINYFNHATLSALLERCGFSVIGSSSMFPIDFFLLMGDNYVGNDEVGRASHLRRKRLDIMLNEPGLKEFKKEMYGIMAKHGIGREAVIFGKKEKR